MTLVINFFAKFQPISAKLKNEWNLRKIVYSYISTAQLQHKVRKNSHKAIKKKKWKIFRNNFFVFLLFLWDNKTYLIVNYTISQQVFKDTTSLLPNSFLMFYFFCKIIYFLRETYLMLPARNDMNILLIIFHRQLTGNALILEKIGSQHHCIIQLFLFILFLRKVKRHIWNKKINMAKMCQSFQYMREQLSHKWQNLIISWKILTESFLNAKAWKYFKRFIAH